MKGIAFSTTFPFSPSGTLYASIIESGINRGLWCGDGWGRDVFAFGMRSRRRWVGMLLKYVHLSPSVTRSILSTSTHPHILYAWDIDTSRWRTIRNCTVVVHMKRSIQCFWIPARLRMINNSTRYPSSHSTDKQTRLSILQSKHTVKLNQNHELFNHFWST